MMEKLAEVRLRDFFGLIYRSHRSVCAEHIYFFFPLCKDKDLCCEKGSDAQRCAGGRCERGNSLHPPAVHPFAGAILANVPLLCCLCKRGELAILIAIVECCLWARESVGAVRTRVLRIDVQLLLEKK